MQKITIDLRVSADEYLKFYRGEADVVTCRARDGRRIQFPVKILNPYLTRDGVSGSFEIQFDNHGKFQSIERL
ncbi:MAG: DUF2835 domain-containing protein [Halopseudomonas sp.]